MAKTLNGLLPHVIWPLIVMGVVGLVVLYGSTRAMETKLERLCQDAAVHRVEDKTIQYENERRLDRIERRLNIEYERR